jgi:hypothetical protein
MSMYTVHQGKHYRAMFALNWVEQIASNELITQRLRDAGFAEVHVKGQGHTREATAFWPRKDTTAQIPPQIISIQEIEV